MTKMFIIGDVHGKYDKYLELIDDKRTTVQLGDFGFDYYDILDRINPQHHRILAGNHDNYFDMNYPHFLGDYGAAFYGEISFFFIRGGRSIDRQQRIEGVTWWAEEELSYHQANEAIKVYERDRPRVMISHECPVSALEQLPIAHNDLGFSYTTKLLETCWRIHQPEFWFFGHHHISMRFTLDETCFVALGELEGVEFDGNSIE